MKPNILCLAALAAAMLVPRGALAQEGISRTAGDPARAQVLAYKFNVDQQRVLGMRQQLGMEWVEIEQALGIAGAVTNSTPKVTMDAALNKVLSVRAMGQAWPDIAQQFGATLPIVQAAKVIMQPVATTNVAGTAADKGSRVSKIRDSAVSRASTKSAASEKVPVPSSP